MGGSPPLTEAQKREVLEAKERYDSDQAAADALGIPRSTFQSRVERAKSARSLPDDAYIIKGTSTLVDAEGNEKLTWIKTALDKERQEQILRETIAGMVEDIKPAKPVKIPPLARPDLCTAIAIGDAHIGLYTWGEETGEDFDLSIAQRDLEAGVSRVIEAAPAADECLIAQLGDFYHIDDATNVTPASGNRLDVDSRFPKVIRCGINTLRFAIDLALQKYQRVTLRNVAGNHDPHAAITLQEAMRGYYYDEPRLILADTPRPFYTYRFGKCLIGLTHGHQGKPDRYPGILAVDAAQDWAECEHKYVWHGHIHQRRVFEEMGVLVESFRTLANPDAWAIGQGYRPGRELQAIVLHTEYGEVERHTAGIKRIRGEDG